MAAIPRPTGLEHLTGDGLTLQKQMFGPSDPLSTSIVDRRDQPATLMDYAIADFKNRFVEDPPWANSGDESNLLLDQLKTAISQGIITPRDGAMQQRERYTPYPRK